MNKKLSQFMEFQHPEETITNLKWYSILHKMIVVMDEYFDLKTQDFSSFSDYVIANKNLDSKNAYFWDWLDIEGISYLRKTDKVFPDTEDVVDFLNYREMLLEMDSESGLVENFIISITELFKSTSNFIESYLKNAIYQSISHNDFNDIRVPQTLVTSSGHYVLEDKWKIYESSAKITAELLAFR